MNTVLLIGHMSSDLDITEDNCEFIVEVTRSIREEDGEIVVDRIPCVATSNIRNDMIKYNIKPGDVLGVRGKLQIKDGLLEVFVERISFASSTKE